MIILQNVQKSKHTNKHKQQVQTHLCCAESTLSMTVCANVQEYACIDIKCVVIAGYNAYLTHSLPDTNYIQTPASFDLFQIWA